MKSSNFKSAVQALFVTTSALVAAAAIPANALTVTPEKTLPKRSASLPVLKVQQSQKSLVRFVNQAGYKLEYYYIDPQTRQPQLVGSLNPGQYIDLQSVPGLNWVFGVNGQQIQAFQTQPAPFQELLITPAGQQLKYRTIQDPNLSAPVQQNQVIQQQSTQERIQPGQNVLIQPNGATNQEVTRIQREQRPLLTRPVGFENSTMTINRCMKTRFAEGAPQFKLCAYLYQIRRTNPDEYEAYMARVNANNGTSSTSPQPADYTQYSAASWGGVVRDGPSMEANRIGSLAEKQDITLLENTGSVMNGYSWFKIQYDGNKIGYQWGGVICGVSQEIPGAHKICN